MSLTQLATEGTWTNAPVEAGSVLETLYVVAQEGSDAWRETSYGFVHDTEHALLEPFGAEGAVEVQFLLDFDQQFDQAGLFLRVDSTEWIKAGVEISDGTANVGAVVTHRTSDWSVSPVGHWMGTAVTVRLSRRGDAVTIRARSGHQPWQLVRVANLEVEAPASVGIYCCSPSRSGLRVSFIGYNRDTADESLHSTH